ncbi:MAG TPA: hypothetical protein VMU20_11530 [Candidatus Dormibacteraeota bacterium]|nr:hypothetical protein [Candidatus Dormibacteraeota bacterium]
MTRRRGVRDRRVIEPGRRVGASALGAAWLARLRDQPGRERSALDRGRMLAEGGAVGVPSWEPGRVSARVQGGDGDGTCAVVLRVERLGLPAWRGVVETMAREPRLLAAVLDGELPEEVVTAAGGVDALVPAPTEARLACSCSTWTVVCDHAAAVWYVAAHAIDGRPARLLDLRGHDGDLVAAVRRRAIRNRSRAARSAEDPGIDVVTAFVRVPAAPPEPMPLPERPGMPERLPARPGAARAIRSEDVHSLAVDAAHRAWELATAGGDAGLGLDADADLARRVGPLADDQAALIATATATGIDAWSLARLGLAWRAGGAAAVAVLLRPWSAPPAWLTPGMDALAWLGPPRCRHNRVTSANQRLQLRVGRDGCWYLLRAEDDTWVLCDPPCAHPADLLRGAGPEAPSAAAGDDVRAAPPPPRPTRRAAARAGDANQLTLPW